MRKKCEFIKTDKENIYHCPNCDREIYSKSDNIVRNCRPRKIGLGDIVESGIETLGVANVGKKIIEKITGKSCGCNQRKTRLNDLGDKIIDIFGV